MTDREIVRQMARGEYGGVKGEERSVLREMVAMRRLKAWTWAAIAEDLGISDSFCQKLFGEWRELHPVEDADTVRYQEIQRLDVLERVALESFVANPSSPNWDAFKAVMEVSKRRAALLGLDAPTRTEAKIQLQDKMDVELEDIVRQAWEDAQG